MEVSDFCKELYENDQVIVANQEQISVNRGDDSKRLLIIC